MNTLEVVTVPTDVGNLYDGKVYDDALYSIGLNAAWGDEYRYAVMKLSKDGTYEPASGMVGQFASTDFDIFDEYLYMISTLDTGGEAIHRLPLGQGTDAPFRPHLDPGAELVAESVAASKMATDGTYLYYKPSHASAGLGRVRLGALASAEIINEEFSFNFASDMGLPEADPEHLYFALTYVHRVPRAGGPSEEIIDIPGIDIWAGASSLVFYDDDDNILYAVDDIAPSVTVLDDDGDRPISTAGTPSGYVIVSARGVVRIQV